MTAYQLVAAVVPRHVKDRLRGKGRHRAAGRPLLVNLRLAEPRHRALTGLDRLDPLYALNTARREGGDW